MADGRRKAGSPVAMIQFQGVSKIYPGHEALRDVSLEIEGGSFVFLIGPSGAGKTTMLRLIIRDLVPTEGKVLVDDWEVNALKSGNIHHLRRKVGMIFQDFKILTDRTVYENVALGLEILGKKKHEIEKGVMDVLDIVDLADKHHKFPQELSAGEMQRTSIARAIVAGPKILLADEPTGNLDPHTADKIMDILDEINELGTTILVATHNADIVNTRKKRTIAMQGGRVVSDEKKGKYVMPTKKESKKHHEKEKSAKES